MMKEKEARHAIHRTWRKARGVRINIIIGEVLHATVIDDRTGEHMPRASVPSVSKYFARRHGINELSARLWALIDIVCAVAYCRNWLLNSYWWLTAIVICQFSPTNSASCSIGTFLSGLFLTFCFFPATFHIVNVNIHREYIAWLW